MRDTSDAIKKISAHYVFPVTSAPLKRGIISLDRHHRILAIEPYDSSRPEQEGVAFYDGVLVPGFINCHCHLELSYLHRKVPPHTGLPGFIEALTTFPKPAFENIQAQAEKAEKQLLHAGVVACGDICNTADTFPLKQAQKILYHNFIELMGTRSEDAEGRFHKGVLLAEEAKRIDASFRVSLTPHATYSISGKLAALLAARKEPRYSLHHQETASELNFLRHGQGDLFALLKRKGLLSDQAQGRRHYPIEVLRDYPPQARMLLVHNTYISEEELTLISKTFKHYHYILCPKSNLHIENKMPPIDMLYETGQPIALGTDSLASNSSLSILEEIKSIHQAFPGIPFNDLLRWSTLNGALALGFEKKLGSFEVGKQAGVNLICNFDYKNMQVKQDSSIKRLI